MGGIPDRSNFFASLYTSLSRRRVAGLFTPLGWHVRRCSWIDYEVLGPYAELIIEAESPILLHGSVADVEANADRILAPLRQAGVSYTAECYDAEGGLLQEFRWVTA